MKRMIGNKKSPWITYESVRKMGKRDFLKRKLKAEQSKDQCYWAAFKVATNEDNNLIKYAKRRYFDDNLAANRKDPRTTWQPINELSSRQHKKKVIADIEIEDNKNSSALEMAEAFNCHLANIGHDLAKDVPPIVKEPEYCLNPTNKTFSLNSCSTSEVQNYSKIYLLRKRQVWIICHPSCLN